MRKQTIRVEYGIASYTMMAKPMNPLELLHPIIHFFVLKYHIVILDSFE